MSPSWPLSSGEHTNVSLEMQSVCLVDLRFKINYIGGLIIFMSVKFKNFSLFISKKWFLNQVSYS